MPIVSSGSSVEYDIPINTRFEVSTLGEAYVDALSGPIATGGESVRVMPGREYRRGPYTVPCRVRVRCISGSAVYGPVVERQPVFSETGTGGVVRTSNGLAVGELGVGSVIYAQRQHPGYLPANGAVYSRAAYPALRATIGTVPDGAGTWTSRTSAADNQWRSVCWSPELSLFCAVAASGTGNRVMTSPDGINWTSRTSAADLSWFGVCWSPERSLFCAVASSGTGNQVMTSPDGINWTSRTSAADLSWYSVCWSPELSLFCAVAIDGASNRVMTSPDGINWTARTSAASISWLGVCWSPERSLFCAVALSGTGNRVMTNAPAATYNPTTQFKLPILPNATSGEARAFIYAGA